MPGTSRRRWRRSCAAWTDFVGSVKCSYIGHCRSGEPWRWSANLLADSGLHLSSAFDSIFWRSGRAARDLLPMGQELELGIAAWSPSTAGNATAIPERVYKGKVGGGQRPALLFTEHKRAIVRVLSEVAHEGACTAGQARWRATSPEALHHAVSPILGARKVSQIKRTSLRRVVAEHGTISPPRTRPQSFIWAT